MGVSGILRALIMGAPGSGKGTIAQRIIKDFDMKYLASGDLLRNEIAKKSEIGLKCEKYIKSGSLVPDSVIDELIFSNLQNLKSECWLLDGFPRTLEQAEKLCGRSFTPDIVIGLNVPFDVIIARVKGRWTHVPSGRVYNEDFNKPKVLGRDDVTGEPLIQRPDDQPETVLARLQLHQRQSQPIIDFFKNKGLLTEFEGKTSNEMWPHIRKHLTTLCKPVKEIKYT